MKMNYFIIVFLSIFIFSCYNKTYVGELVIDNTNVIDVATGKIMESQDVIINADTIAYIVEHGSIKIHTTVTVNGTDQYLIPGLWDMHAHHYFAYKDFSPLLIANGVTGIRQMWGDLEETKKIRHLTEMDSLVGPDIISAGVIVDGNPPFWRGADVADTQEKGREIVRRQKAEGADFIKVYANLEKDVYFAIADECKKQNIPMVGHIPNRVSLEEALEAGHQSVEHFYGILDVLSSKYKRLQLWREGKLENDTLDIMLNRWDYIYETYDKEREPIFFELMEKYQPWIVPTLVYNKGSIRSHDPNYPYDERIDYLPASETNKWKVNPENKKTKWDTLDYKTLSNTYSKISNLLKPMKDHQARFLAGTDYTQPFTYPGFSVHEELELFVEAGFTNLEALQTATINPAIFLDIENEIGSVEVGKRANLVLLAKNPLDNIKNTSSIQAVILRGKYFQGLELREEIEAIATHNRKPKIKDKLLPVILEDGIEAGIETYYKLKQFNPNVYNFDKEQLNTLGYELLDKKRKEEALKIFQLNVELFPIYANGFDSLGDAYENLGDKENAKKAWQKAIELGYAPSKYKLSDPEN